MTDPVFPEESNLEDRIPCADDTCIGVIGEDGCCGTCGRRYDGESALPAPVGAPPEPSDPLPGHEDASTADEPDPLDRVPCADDTCIGILGPDGRCGTCGRSV